MNKHQIRNSIRELDTLPPLPCPANMKAIRDFCNCRGTLEGMFPLDEYTYWAFILFYKPELMEVKYVPFIERTKDSAEWRAVCYLKEFKELPDVNVKVPDIVLDTDRKEYNDWVKLLVAHPELAVDLLEIGEFRPDLEGYNKWKAKGSPASVYDLILLRRLKR